MSKILIISVLFSLIAFAALSSSDNDCTEMAEATRNVSKCCNTIHLVTLEAYKQADDEMPKDLNRTSSLYICLLVQKIFEISNFKELNKAEALLYNEKITNDTDWLSVLHKAADYCIDCQRNMTDRVQMSFGLTDDECNAAYIGYYACLREYTENLCPLKSLNDTERCKATSNFLENCRENEEAVEHYLKIHALF